MAKIIIVIEKWTKLGTIRKVPNSFRPCLYPTAVNSLFRVVMMRGGGGGGGILKTSFICDLDKIKYKLFNKIMPKTYSSV